MSEEVIKTPQELEEESGSFFDLRAIIDVLILNWQWFALSLIICLGIAFLHLRYTTPYYSAFAKMFVKTNSTTNLRSINALGEVVQSYGMENEKLILKSTAIAEETIRDLKLYTRYSSKGLIRNSSMYKTQPVTVEIDPVSVEKLNRPINLKITRKGEEYHVEGTYYIPIDEVSSKGPYGIDRMLSKFPCTIRTKAGYLTFYTTNRVLDDGDTELVTINSPSRLAGSYAGRLNVADAEGTSIITLSIVDDLPIRAIDYLNQIVNSYNRQANEDKNEVAVRTEEFINDRIAKISGELSSTESTIESYRNRQALNEMKATVQKASENADQTQRQMNEVNMQLMFINDLDNAISKPSNKYQMMPANVTDASVSQLIAQYNTIVGQRNRLLRTAAENSPAVEPLTFQLDELYSSIKMTLDQARHNAEFRRNMLMQQHGQYMSAANQSPEHERMLSQIGRQQEVKSGLYLMLLQKREENSISLSSTADKGKLIDTPKYGGQVSPNPKKEYLIALATGLAIPSLIFFFLYFFRYRIEGHEDVVKLTDLPILADVAVANESAKTKADIVVHENQNNQMEEVFRAMRTNLQFMMKENDKVVMFTSTTSGEGKTFNAANLAVSFALLHKKVILVGLDIRKPRLAEQFEIEDETHGITPILTHDHPTLEDVRAQILPSGVHDDLDLLLAGPIPPNPTEIVSRQSLDEIFQILRDEYDYIIVDTAPVGLVSDTLQIGRVCDVTVYMCRADFTPKSSFELINGLSADKKLPNMAIVINGIDMSKKKYGYYYGYGRYGKYSRYGSYGRYGKYGRYGTYGSYGSYGTYGTYGNYSKSRYSNREDDSVKR
jgi:capsular exopolysaccharide synthesis family protein